MTTSSQDPTQDPDLTKVSVGPTSTVGWLVAALAFAAAAVSFFTGDHTAQTTLVPGLLGLGGVSHFTVMAGRYLQSHGQLKVAAAEAVAFAEEKLPTLEEELAAPPAPPVTIPAHLPLPPPIPPAGTPLPG